MQRSLTAHSRSIIPVYALKFTFNDMIRDALLKPGQSVSQLSFSTLLLSGTLAGLLQMAITYPLETVRTRMTLSADLTGGVRYTGVANCFAQTLRVEGAPALFKGLAPALASGAPYVGARCPSRHARCAVSSFDSC